LRGRTSWPAPAPQRRGSGGGGGADGTLRLPRPPFRWWPPPLAPRRPRAWCKAARGGRRPPATRCSAQGTPPAPGRATCWCLVAAAAPRSLLTCWPTPPQPASGPCGAASGLPRPAGVSSCCCCCCSLLPLAFLSLPCCRGAAGWTCCLKRAMVSWARPPLPACTLTCPIRSLQLPHLHSGGRRDLALRRQRH
jgi:hypothetical protein